jgi:drug/metabolite transporter (DMT)-like permease
MPPVPLLLAVVVVAGGLAYPVTGAALEHTTPEVIAVTRALVGAAVLVALLPALGGRLPRTWRLWGWAAAIGAANTTLTLLGISEGTSQAGAAVASVLLNSSPIFAAILARLALDERLRRLQVLGLVVGFAGILAVVLANPGEVGHGRRLAVGLLLSLLGAIGWAAGGVAMRWLAVRGDALDVYGLSAAQFLCGGVLLAPAALLVGRPGASDWSSPTLWWSLAFLVLGGHVLVYVGFNLALGQWPSGRVYAWTFLVPVVAVAVEATRGRLPGAVATVGMAVTIAGVAIVNAPERLARTRNG